MATPRTRNPAPDDVIVVIAGDHPGDDLARRLVDAGHHVAVVGSSVTHLVASVAGSSAMAVVVDIDDPAMVCSMFERVERRLGPVTMVADPAGALVVGPWRTDDVEVAHADGVAISAA